MSRRTIEMDDEQEDLLQYLWFGLKTVLGYASLEQTGRRS